MRKMKEKGGEGGLSFTDHHTEGAIFIPDWRKSEDERASLIQTPRTGSCFYPSLAKATCQMEKIMICFSHQILLLSQALNSKVFQVISCHKFSYFVEKSNILEKSLFLIKSGKALIEFQEKTVLERRGEHWVNLF